MGIGLLSGVLTGLALLFTSPLSVFFLPPELLEGSAEVTARLTPLAGLGGSLMAGVIEEIEFRLGAMTLLVWVGAWLTRRRPPAAGIVWTANLLVAVVFGLLHLSNVLIIGGPITVGTVVYVLLANGLAAVVFGWLYWRYGLESAIASHIVLDIMLHVVPLLLRDLLQSFFPG